MASPTKKTGTKAQSTKAKGTKGKSAAPTKSTTRKTAAAKKAAPKKSATATPATGVIAHIADFQARNLEALQGGTNNKTMESMMTKSKAQFEKLSNDAAAVGKENMDAWMKSGSIFMKGYEDIVKTCMTLAQQNAEKNGEAFKTMLACKTANEFAELQTRLAQQGFDDFMQGATQLSEMTVKLASDSMAPINDQLGKSIKKASDAMAA